MYARRFSGDGILSSPSGIFFHPRVFWLSGRIPNKVILDGLKRNMSRGNSLSDKLELSSVLGDTRAYLYSPVLG